MKIALVGIGKIALDQHVPSLVASPQWELSATCSRAGSVPGIEAYTDFGRLLAERPEIEAVSLCLPPVPRFDYAAQAIAAGRHVMLEKPPGATLAECHQLEDLARNAGVSIFATWHSREAARVAAAKAWLASKDITRAHITWREDVRKWHPGQDWVFEAGGMGVFDPGINALSILTEILPDPIRLLHADLEVPENRQGPIAAQLRFSNAITADFDWRQEGPQSWTIEVETSEGFLTLREGGDVMEIDGREAGEDSPGAGEYPRLYAKMAELVAAQGIDMDLAPLRHVADAFMLGHRRTVAPFEW